MNVPADDDEDASYCPSDIDGGEEKEEVLMVDDDEEQASPSSSKKLESITFDDKVQLYSDAEGKQRWRCRWCNKTFHWNPTKALFHLAKIARSDIAVCKAKMDDVHAERYRALYNAKTKKRDSNVAVLRSLSDSMEEHNTNTASVLDGKRRRTSTTSPGTGSRTSKSGGSSTVSTHATMNTIITEGTSTNEGQHGMKKFLQLKVHDGSNASVESKLTMAIADMIHSCGLPFSLSSNIKFRKVLHLARNVPTTYRPPGRNQVAVKLLDINYESYMDKNKKLLSEDIDIFGLTFYGDGATVRKMPLINILASGGHLHTAVMEIVDATEQMQNSGKKDARYLASLFRPHIDAFEKKFPNCIDYCTFDGAGSVQKAGQVLNARYPRIVVTHGAEHVVSLFFRIALTYQLFLLYIKSSERHMLFLGVGPNIVPMPYSKSTVRF